MNAHPVAPGQSIKVDGVRYVYPQVPPLSADDVALFLSLDPPALAAAVAPSAPVEAPAPVVVAPPTPDDDGAEAPLVLPDPLPPLSALAAHLKGKSEDYIRAMWDADTRKGQTAQGHYKRALRDLT